MASAVFQGDTNAGQLARNEAVRRTERGVMQVILFGCQHSTYIRCNCPFAIRLSAAGCQAGFKEHEQAAC